METTHCYDFDREIERHGTGALKTDALAELFGRADITPLWVADMDFAIAPEIVEGMTRRMSHPIYGYASTPESYWQSIIDWLARRHGWKVDREELLFTPGVVRGIAYVLNFFTKPGNTVLIQPPVYHPFRLVTEGNNRRVVTNPLKFSENGTTLEMDFDDLERKLEAEHPALMILCNPHNPAGIQWSRDDLARVASLCRRHGVIVISDEIHGDLMLYGKRHIPFLSVGPDAEAVGITLGAPSKTFNIPGIISSWIVVKNPALRKPFYEWMECNEFSSPTFMATTATEIAYRTAEPWLEEMLRYIEGNIAAVERYFAENIPEIKPMRPQASFLVWLDCRRLGLSQAELTDLFINHARLALNDGEMFGVEGRGFMRLNVATPRHRLLKALKRLATALHPVTI